jgi:hypothetical protein
VGFQRLKSLHVPGDGLHSMETLSILLISGAFPA